MPFTYLDVVKSCDDFPFGPVDDVYYQLFLPNDDQPHGFITPDTVEKMPWTADFSVCHDKPRKVIVLDSLDGKDTAAAANQAFAKIVSICIERDLFHVLCRRHSEPFQIVSAKYTAPIYVERFATSLFGLTTSGVHLIAYVNTPEGMKIWVPRRSAHLYTYPNMLDVTVGGGVKSDASPMQTIIEEGDEEASLPEGLLRQKACSRGVISHMGLTGKGFPGEQGLVTPDYIYVYDVELPTDVIPRPRDDEVNLFYCMSVGEVQDALRRQEFKPDSGAVMIDFFIRHGIITPENEKDFVEINTRLHRHLPFIVGPK